MKLLKFMVTFELPAIMLLLFCLTDADAQVPAVSGPEIDCESTLAAWRLDPNMREYAKNCKCKCRNCMPDCEQSSTSGSPTSGGLSGGGQNISQQMALPLFESAIASLLQGIFASPDNSKQEQLDKEKKLADEQARQKALQEWQKRQFEENLKRQMEVAARLEEGKKMLSQMQTVGGGGGLQPFSIGGDPKLDIKPISQNSFPTPKSEWDRLLCSAYFSDLAKKSTKDIEARFYEDQAQKVMSGQPTDCECRIPHASNEQTAKRMEEINKLYDVMSAKINDVRDVDRQLLESKDKKMKAQAKKEEVMALLNGLQNRPAAAEPEEKAREDELEKQARELLQVADQQINEAEQSEKDALKKKEQLKEECNNLQSQMKSKIQESD